MSLFLVGQHKYDSTDGTVWEYQGIFSTEQKGINACITDDYFLIEVADLDVEITKESLPESGYYPLVEDRDRNPL